MEQQLYVNGKPLVKPPQTIDEQLNDRLTGCNIQYEDVVRLNERPQPLIIDLDGLKSNYVDKNPLFQSLFGQIMDWNEKVTLHRAGQITLIKPYVNDRLFRSLRNQLKEVANCRNRAQQQEYLNKVAQWFYSQLTKSQQIALSQSLQDQKEQLAKFHSQEYPERMYQSSVKDYQDHHRSIHKDFDPPEERVKQYQRKNLLSDTSTRPGTTPQNLGLSQISRPQTSQTTYKMIEAIDKASRPRTNQQQQLSQSKLQPSFIYDSNFPVFETFEEQKTTRRNIFRQDSPLKAEKPALDEEEEGNNDDEEQSPDMSPDKRNSDAGSPMKQSTTGKKKKKERADKYISIAPDRKTYFTDKQTEMVYQSAPSGRAGELQSNFIMHDPISDDQAALARLNQIYINNRHRDLKEQREDIEMISSMKGWANNKGRVEEMIVHKGYLSQMGSQFQNVGIKTSELYESKPITIEEEKAYSAYLNKSCVKTTHSRMVQSAIPMATTVIENTMLPTQVEEEIEDYQQKQAYLELKINSAKLQNLKKSRGSWLPGGLKHAPSTDAIQSRKMLSSSSFKNQNMSQRPFSGVFRHYSIKQESDQQICEVNTIKNRLASAQQFVPIKVLQKSLVIPQGHKEPHKILLPHPSMMLANIPMAATKGRGKKGKSKKK